MTMNLIKHGTPRAGFKDWPTYDNKPGKGEPEIARCAFPDPDWEKETPPRAYNTSKTSTGEKIAIKIRDLRLRKNLTGSTANPRLCKKTNIKNVAASAQVDFEEEIKRYKQEIEEDIKQYKNQPYVEPGWVKAALGQDNGVAGATSSSSSSWERPLTDSQAVEISDALLTEREMREFLSEESGEEESGPAWEQQGFAHKASYEYPHNLLPYGPEAYGAFWEKWLEELVTPPPQDYYQQNAASVIAHYDKRTADNQNS